MIDSKDLEFWFHKTAAGTNLRLRVNPKHHGKSVDFINELTAMLKEKVPAGNTMVFAPEVHILGGQRLPGVITIQVTVTFDHILAEAIRQLKEAGFKEGTDPLIG